MSSSQQSHNSLPSLQVLLPLCMGQTGLQLLTGLHFLMACMPPYLVLSPSSLLLLLVLLAHLFFSSFLDFLCYFYTQGSCYHWSSCGHPHPPSFSYSSKVIDAILSFKCWHSYVGHIFLCPTNTFFIWISKICRNLSNSIFHWEHPSLLLYV